MKWVTLLIFVLYSSTIQAINVVELLNEINPDDRESLEGLFQSFIYKDHFGYTIFGDKPISLSGDFTLTPWENTITGDRSGGCFWKKWDIWKKYKSLFPIHNFIFLEEQSYNYSDIKFVLVINKKSFLKAVKKYQRTFNEILGYQVNPEKLLQSIESGFSKFQSAIQNSEILWGILLGYGEHNARLYERKNEMTRLIGRSKLILKNTNPSMNFQSIEDEKKFLDAMLQSFNDSFDCICFINPVNFVADLTHPETLMLKRKYLRLDRKISSIFANGNVLQITLTQLTAR